jgi:hypothetical protein
MIRPVLTPGFDRLVVRLVVVGCDLRFVVDGLDGRSLGCVVARLRP